MARIGPSKYTEERTNRLVAAIALGATRGIACLYAGIDMTTLCDWERKYPAFAARMREAEGAATVGWLSKIEDAAKNGIWQAAAWKLERRYPRDYGRRIDEQWHANATGDGPIEVIHDLRTWSATELDAVALIQRKLAEPGGD